VAFRFETERVDHRGRATLAHTPDADQSPQSSDHELQHAVEIADRATAVAPSSIRALYGTIGFATDDRGQHFESNAAKEAGNRVRREWSSSPLDLARALVNVSPEHRQLR